jgi:hypothetical protein
MIIRPANDTLLLITQPDHAAVAVRMMEHWTANGLLQNARRNEILLAVREHDNGWREVDQGPVIDRETGRPLDFIHVPHAIKQAVWPRGIERLKDTPYAAALVAQHALHIHQSLRADAAWAPFFVQVEALRHEHLEHSGVEHDQLLRDYSFVRIADLLSLAFCNAWTDPKTDEFGYTARLDQTTLTVSPDPFQNRSVSFEISARELPNRVYRSDTEALAAYQAAPYRTLRGVVVGTGSGNAL